MASKQTAYNDAMAVGFAGQLLAEFGDGIVSMMNSEASLEMAFGMAVKFGGVAGNNQSAKIPTAETDKICGIVLHTHAYGDADLGQGANGGAATVRPGVKPGKMINVLRKGRVRVIVEDAVSPGDRLWVRAVSAGDGVEFLGGALPADDGTDTVDCTNQGVFLTAAGAGELAVLEVDFTNDAT